MDEGVQVVAERKQHSILIDVEQSEAISARAEQERRTFNEMVRVIFAGWMRGEKPTGGGAAGGKEVMVQLYREDPRYYRNAQVEYDGSKDRLDILRGERCIASFDASGVEHWDAGEEDE